MRKHRTYENCSAERNEESTFILMSRISKSNSESTVSVVGQRRKTIKKLLIKIKRNNKNICLIISLLTITLI